MPLFALAPGWNDFYTVGGFVVGVVGFGVTLWQLRKTKHAAEAAAVAAGKTLAENKESYERFVGAFASRLMSELQHAVNESDWKIAKVRAHDLAELLGTSPATGAAALDGVTRTAGDNLREFAQTFAECDTAKRSTLPGKLLKEQWKPLLRLLHRRLDHLRAPFRERDDGEVGPLDPGGDVPRDRPEPPGEDEGGAGELGPYAGPRPDA